MINGNNGIFSNVQGLFARFFEKKTKSVIGVDIGSSAIKVVQLVRKGGRAILETYGELALGPYAGFEVGQATNLAEDRLSEALTDIIREANVTSREAGMAIPLAASLVSVIEMPTPPGVRLEEVVPLEVRRYIPVPIAEVSLDWQVIPDEGRGSALEEPEEKSAHPAQILPTRSRILFAAIHNETLGKYQNVAKKSGLSLGFLEIESFASMRSLLGRERITVLIMDIGAGATKLSIVEAGVVASTHIINKGSQDITLALSQSQGIEMHKAELLKREVGLSDDIANKETSQTMQLIINTIFAETNKMVLDFEKKRHRIIDKVILSGGGALLKGILPVAQRNFNTTVVFAEPFARIETPAFLEPVLKDVGPNFAVAAGIALRKIQEAE